MANAAQKPTPFMLWWEEVNDRLAHVGCDQMLYGDARHWFNQGFSADTAAELHAEETAS